MQNISNPAHRFQFLLLQHHLFLFFELGLKEFKANSTLLKKLQICNL